LVFDKLGHEGLSTHYVSSVLKILYPDAVKHNNYSKTLTSVAFAGTFVGMLIFGWISDKIGRKFGMVRTTSGISEVHLTGLISSQMFATGIVAFFSGLSAASTGAHHSTSGLLAMLCACR
jgi:MFS family permease